MAVSLGYQNVFRDPQGFPQWQAAGLAVAETPATPLTEKQGDLGPLTGWAVIFTLVGVFFGGMALNLTPCVYPLIPITVSYFGGRSGQAGLVAHGICYIGGLALANSVLGVTAALTGGLMGSALQHPAVLIGVAVLILALASSLFGFWELRMPQAFTQAAAKSYTGYFGSVFMGLTMGVVAAPCIGPFVLGLLTWVASMGNALMGFLVFFVLSLGLGIPLFVLALFSGKLEKLPRSGMWMIWVRKVMGWVLVGMAAHFVRPLLPAGSAPFILGAVALAAGLHLGFFDRTQASFAAFAWMRAIVGAAGIGLATLLIGSTLAAGPSVQWQSYSQDLLSGAAAAKKPVIIDFSAAWCTPCRELDEITFRHPEIVRRSQGEVIMVKVDVTGKGDATTETLLQRYAVKGVPTVVFIDRQGNEKPELRLVDYLPPEPFLERMERLE